MVFEICFHSHLFCARLSMFSLEVKVQAFVTKDSDGKKPTVRERLLIFLGR
jgi:hypothetical protein